MDRILSSPEVENLKLKETEKDFIFEHQTPFVSV